MVADALSRSPVQSEESSALEEDVKSYVQMVESNLPMSPSRMEELQSCTRDDKILQ